MNGPHFRPARASDWPFVAEITRNVWDRTDYLPYTWHQWLGHNSGYLMTAELGGRPVGVLHVELHGESIAWIEGIRVAEEVQGRGLAQAMLQSAVEWAEGAGCRLARLSTSSGNPASNRMAEKVEMEVIAKFVPTRAAPSLASAGVVAGVRPALASEAEIVGALLSRRSGGTDGALYTEGWTAYNLSTERLRVLCALHAVAVHDAGGEISGACISTCAPPFQYLRTGAMAGSPGSVSTLAAYLRDRAAAGGLSHVRSTLALDPEGTEAMRAAGFERPHDSLMLVYERKLG